MNDLNKTSSSTNTGWYHSPWLERCLFLLVLLMEAGIFIYLINSRSVVGGHDGFLYFTLQYYFLNNVVNYGEIPQWVPFVTHGVVSTMGYIVPGSILHNTLLISGEFFKNTNFLPLFYAGVFIDELLLLAGVWLLARRFFASPLTVFFVSVSVMGSCIWVLQPWWNFHLYYAIPLMLYLGHRFLDSGKWRYYFLAGNLLFMQSLGNLPYFLPVISLVIFLYFLFYAALNFEDTWNKLKTLRFGTACVATTALMVLSFAILYYAMTFGTDQIANYNLRNPDGTTSLEGFLTYGGQFTWRAWLELILGVSPCLDYTLYIGILCLPFIVLGFVFNLNKQNTHFLLITIILVLFSMGTFVSVFFYYTWPMMTFFRHLMLVSPIIKVFLCFLAGFGFNALIFNQINNKKSFATIISLFFIPITLLSLSILLWALSNNYSIAEHLIRSMVPKQLPAFSYLFKEEIISYLLTRTSIIALIAFIVFCFFMNIKKKRILNLIIIILLGLHFADIYGFKFYEIKIKITPLNETLYKINDFQPVPYPKRRELSFWQNNPRADLLMILPIHKGEMYWTTHMFFFKDELGNPHRTDFWLLPLDNYMRAYWGQSIHDLSIKPKGLLSGERRLEFPQTHPAILKISGVTEDKIQLFSHADIVNSDDIVASYITHPDYKGDRIFLSRPDKQMQGISDDFPAPQDIKLSSDQRLRLPYEVLRFDANNIEISADNNSPEPVWLFYSDVWHPRWRATVNGKPTPVYKANLAYKAVKLEPGSNTVHFYFKSTFMSALYLVFGLNALLWMMMIIGLTGMIALNKKHLTEDTMTINHE